MKLHHTNGIFWAESTIEERHIPKEAGFRWHGNPGSCWGKCAACASGIGKHWWTDIAPNALLLLSFADPAAYAVLEATRTEIDASRAAAMAEELFNVPAPEGLAYLPYQKAGITYALRRERCIIGDEMGLGKTIQGIGFVNGLPDPRRVLIVCPPSLRMNWAREFDKWTVLPWDITVVHKPQDLLRFTDSELQDPFMRRAVIISYNRIGGKRNAELNEKLQRVKWDALIGDEIHLCKNPKSQRSQGLFGKRNCGVLETPGLAHSAARLVLLTGTAIANRPIELFPLLEAVDPEGLGANFMRFAKRYCGAMPGAFGWDFGGATNLTELQERLRATCFVRRLKSDVLKELPPKRRQVIALDPEGNEKVLLRQAEAYSRHEDALQTLEETMELADMLGDQEGLEEAAKALSEARKVAFKDMARERKAVAMAKVPAVLEHVTALLESTTSSVILFAHHKDVVAALREHTGTDLVITGETPAQDRQAIVDRFQAGEHRVFIGNIHAAGVGLTLTRADTVVFAELDWTPANMLQAEDRAHRIGQSSKVLCQYLVFDGSVDARMLSILHRKMEVIEKALDSTEGRSMDRAYLLASEERDRKKAYTKTSRWPVATPEQREAAAFAMQSLAIRCDGAREQDGQGFNALDTRFGKQLAARAAQRPLTDGEVAAAAKLARKYQRQLPLEEIACLWVAGEAAA